MRLRYADTATPVHAAKVGDRIRERRTGEVRSVAQIARTLTEFRLYFDDDTYIEAGIFDTVMVVQEPGGQESER